MEVVKSWLGGEDGGMETLNSHDRFADMTLDHQGSDQGSKLDDSDRSWEIFDRPEALN